MESENPSGVTADDHENILIGESLPVLIGDYFWIADYRKGTIKRWLWDRGIDYRGSDIEIVTDEKSIPQSIMSRFYYPHS